MDVILNNVQHLYPISESVAKFFQSLEVNSTQKKRIAKAPLKPIKNANKVPLPDYYILWVLSIFADSPDWNQADDLLAIYQNNPSQVIARAAASALAVTGNRSHALIFRDSYNQASPMLKTAILLLCSSKLGADEYKHFKRMQSIDGAVEKKI